MNKKYYSLCKSGHLQDIESNFGPCRVAIEIENITLGRKAGLIEVIKIQNSICFMEAIWAGQGMSMNTDC